MTSVSVLSDRDRVLSESLKSFGVLKPIDGSLLPADKGIAFWVVCSDCHRFSNILDHVRKITNGVQPHPFADHGAPLFLSPESPLNVRNRGDNLLESIGEVPKFKGVAKGWICPHAPCAAATFHKLNIVQQITLVKSGKNRVLGKFPSMDIACLVWLTVREGVEHTYVTDGDLWRQWLIEIYPSLATTHL